MPTQSSQIFGIFNILFSFPKPTYEEGEDVSDVILQEDPGTGDRKTVGDFRGKWLVLFFYPMDNSPGCTREARKFSDLIEDFHRQNAEVIGVSTNSEEKHQKFIEKQDLKVKLIADEEGKLAKLFGIKIFFGMCARDSVVIDPAGKVDTIHKGVSPTSSPEQILNQIREKPEQSTKE